MKLLKIALFDKKSVFFIIGWNIPSIVLVLFIIGIRRRPLLMWDDGPTRESLELIKKYWKPRQIIKRNLIKLINKTPGTYFITGNCKRDGVIDLGISPDKLSILPFFVQSGIFSLTLRKKHQNLSDTILIVAGGRLIESKGFDILIKAVGLINGKTNSHFKLILVGSGEQQSSLFELSKELFLTSLIDFVDWAEPDLWASYIQSSDIFISPARFDHFPTTVLAAMQAGVPVIATSEVGSAIEFIESGRNGIIVPSESPQAIASALQLLINDSNFRKLLGKAGKDTISEWSVERGVEIIIDAAKRTIIPCAV